MRYRLVPIVLCFVAASLAHAKKPKEPVEEPPVEEAPVVVEAPAEGPRQVQAKADVDGAKGARATVVGMLKRVTPEGVEGAEEATAIVLDDGTAILVTQGAPPEGWDWLLESKVRVQGELWASGVEQGATWAVPWLAKAEAPMPGDVGMPGMGF